MTPRYKATELVLKFYEVNSYESMSLVGKRLLYQSAKIYAEICCTEILDLIVETYNKALYDVVGKLEDYITYQFWQQVKIEINLLQP